jgi:hypothetical protein
MKKETKEHQNSTPVEQESVEQVFWCEPLAYKDESHSQEIDFHHCHCNCHHQCNCAPPG